MLNRLSHPGAPYSAILKTNTWVWGAWVAQSVERLTLGFSSGHDLTVYELEPCVGLGAEGTEPAWDSLSPSLLPLPLPCSTSLCLSLSK